MLSRCFLDFYVGVGAFFIGQSQISSFFSWPGSQRPLPSLCFRAGRKKKDNDCHPCLWLYETFSTSHLKRLNGIQRHLAGIKISTSSTKFVFFGPIWKTRCPPCVWFAETFSTSPLKPLNGIQRNLTGIKISISSNKFVFLGRSEKTRWLPLSPIGWDSFNFSSETSTMCTQLSCGWKITVIVAMKSKQWTLVTVFADFINYPVLWLTGKVVMLNNYIAFANFYSFKILHILSIIHDTKSLHISILQQVQLSEISSISLVTFIQIHLNFSVKWIFSIYVLPHICKSLRNQQTSIFFKWGGE